MNPPVHIPMPRLRDADGPLRRGARRWRAGLCRLLPAGACAVLGWASPLSAAEISINGFGTVGAAWVDAPAGWAYARSMSHASEDADLRADLDSLAGMQVNYSPSRQIELVGQASVSFLDGEADAADFIKMAFVAWRPHPEWTMRLGRVNLDAYLYSDHRDVGFTFPFMRAPVDFYARMPTSLDGADVARSWVRGDVQWQTKFFAGRTLAGNGSRRLKLTPLFGATVSRESDGLLLRLSAVSARAGDAIPAMQPLIEGLQALQELPVPEVANEALWFEESLMGRDKRTDYLAAGASFDRNRWLLAAEVSRARSQAINSSFDGGYATLGRRFGPVTAYVMHSVTSRVADLREVPDWSTPLESMDPQLAAQAQALAEGATAAFNHGSGEQNTSSAGLRWDLAPRLAVKLQWDHVRTRPHGSGLWAEADGRAARSNVLAVAADFLF